MSIVVVVKKDKEIVIASDSLTTRGSLLVSSKYRQNSEMFIKYKDSWIGCVNDNMSIQMLQHALASGEEEFFFGSESEIYSSMLKLHKILKKSYHLDPKRRQIQNQTVEPTNMVLLIANSSGIYRVCEDKSIDNLSKFWAIGRSTGFALGAMHHVYDNCDAKTIAEIGLKSACEFDENCGFPLQLQTIKEMPCQS